MPKKVKEGASVAALPHGHLHKKEGAGVAALPHGRLHKEGRHAKIVDSLSERSRPWNFVRAPWRPPKAGGVSGYTMKRIKPANTGR